MKNLITIIPLAIIALSCGSEDPQPENIQPLIVAAVNSPSPGNALTDIALSVTLSFNNGVNTPPTATYRLFFDTNSNPTTMHNLGVNRTYTYADLQKNTTYYWKVETMVDGAVVATSDIWRFTTASTQPVINFSPSNQATDIDINGNITFTAGEMTASDANFKLYFDTNSNPTTAFDLGTNTTYTYANLEGDTTYYWKVETIENGVLVATSEVVSFNTLRPLVLNAAPSENFDLSTWKLTLPVSRSGTRDDDAIEISVADLNNQYQNLEYFYTADDGGMVFKCPVIGARTSSGTKYARTELREMLRGTDRSISTQGVNGNNWVFGSAPPAEIAAAAAYDLSLIHISEPRD